MNEIFEFIKNYIHIISPVISLLVILIFFALAYRKRRQKMRKYNGYNNEIKELRGKYKKAKILTSNEAKHSQAVLNVARKKGLNVSYKVRMLDVVVPKDSSDYALLNKVMKKHFDFVLTNKEHDVVLVIELDDSSHNSQSALDRDAVKNTILKDVHIPLLRTRNITEKAILDLLR